MAAGDLKRAALSPHGGGPWEAESRRDESALFIGLVETTVSHSIHSFSHSLGKRTLSLPSGPGASKELRRPWPAAPSPTVQSFPV